MINREIYAPETTLALWCTRYTRDAFPLRYSWKIYLYCFFILKSMVAIKTLANPAFSAHVNLMATDWIKKMGQEKGAKDNWKEKLTGTGPSLPFSFWQKHMDPSAVSSPSVIYLSAFGHEDHLCSCHPLKTLQSPVLNLHVHERIKITYTLLSSIVHQTICPATCPLSPK